MYKQMQGWRIVVIYTADREKKLTAESFFQIRYIANVHAGAAQVKRMCVVVCDAAHVTCKECPVLFFKESENRVVPRKYFRPRIYDSGTFYIIKKENDHERKAAKNQRTRDR